MLVSDCGKVTDKVIFVRCLFMAVKNKAQPDKLLLDDGSDGETIPDLPYV
jgi:hypothetical protein